MSTTAKQEGGTRFAEDEQDDDMDAQRESDCPMAKKLRRAGAHANTGLRPHIFTVAARNAHRRFFIPSKDNLFAGIRYEYIMIDKANKSTLLLPFKKEVMTLFAADHYQWSISFPSSWDYMSGLINYVLKSPILVITTVAGGGVPSSLGSMSLAGSGPLLQLTCSRFHLGTKSARCLSGHDKLSSIVLVDRTSGYSWNNRILKISGMEIDAIVLVIMWSRNVRTLFWAKPISIRSFYSSLVEF